MSEAGEIPANRVAPGEATARQIALAGLVPFVVLAGWLAAIPLDHVWRNETIHLLATYGAVTLSFFGGARWGLAIAGGGFASPRDLALGALAPALGWAALLIPSHYGFVLFAVLFAAQGAWDSLSAQAGALPLWFARLRTQMTIVMVIAMVAAFAATAQG